MIPSQAVRLLIKIGSSGNPDDPATEKHLASLSKWSSINAEHWSVWDEVTSAMSLDNLVKLTKGLALADNCWSCGSVAGAIWTIRRLKERDPAIAEELATWLSTRSRNPYLIRS